MKPILTLLQSLNWHVLLVSVGALLVAGGPVAFLLAAFDVSPDQTASILKRGGAVIALTLAIGAAVKMALMQTDKGKASSLARLDDDAKQRVVAKMPVGDVVALSRAVDKTLNGTDLAPMQPPVQVQVPGSSRTAP